MDSFATSSSFVTAASSFTGEATTEEALQLQARLAELIEVNGSSREATRLHDIQEEEKRKKASEEDGVSPLGVAFCADLVFREETTGFELWLGSLEDVLNIGGLQRRGINGILNCAHDECERECAPFRQRSGGRKRTHARGPSAMNAEAAADSPFGKPMDQDQVRSLVLFDAAWYSDMLDSDVAFSGIAAEDEVGYELDRHFEDSIAFLNQCREEGRRVIVHCIMGINRSSAILIAFLCHGMGMTLPDAVALAARNRGYILSNVSFLAQLVKHFGHGENGHAATEEYARQALSYARAAAKDSALSLLSCP